MYETLVRCLNIVLMWRSPLERRSIQRVRGFQRNDGWRLWWKVGGYHCPSHHMWRVVFRYPSPPIPTQDVVVSQNLFQRWLLLLTDSMEWWLLGSQSDDFDKCVVRSRSRSFIWWHCSALLSIRAQHHTQLRRALCRDFSSNWQARKKEWQRPGVGRRLKEAYGHKEQKQVSESSWRNTCSASNRRQEYPGVHVKSVSTVSYGFQAPWKNIRHHIPVMIIFPVSSSYMHHWLSSSSSS